VKRKELKRKMNIEIDMRAILLLYLIALAATFLNWFVGAVAFLCMTILIVAFLMVAVSHCRKKENDGKKDP
jgi:uncharacterized membrane protein YhaH (DUF805 family)